MTKEEEIEELLGLLLEARNGLRAWTTGYAESSMTVVCTCCEKRSCSLDCECNSLVNRISKRLFEP